MSELKFYLCNTPAGPQYVHLQADAKKLDPNFRTVLIDTSKQALMDRLNELMRGPIQGISLVDDEVEEVESAMTAPQPPPPPRTPAYHPAMPPTTARSIAQTAWEEFIYDIPPTEAFRLTSLEKTIAVRKAEIAGEPPVFEEPPAPHRKSWNKNLDD